MCVPLQPLQKKFTAVKKSFEKTHVRFNNLFHLITRALKRTDGFAGLKAGKHG
jgi:hypothetical protein